MTRPIGSFPFLGLQAPVLYYVINLGFMVTKSWDPLCYVNPGFSLHVCMKGLVWQHLTNLKEHLTVHNTFLSQKRIPLRVTCKENKRNIPVKHHRIVKRTRGESFIWWFSTQSSKINSLIPGNYLVTGLLFTFKVMGSSTVPQADKGNVEITLMCHRSKWNNVTDWTDALCPVL